VISIRTTSPPNRKRGGFWNALHPVVVPVKMTTPGSSSSTLLKSSISPGISTIISSLLPFCRSSPFTQHRRSSRCGSGISSFVAIHGPVGAPVGMPLARVICQNIG